MNTLEGERVETLERLIAQRRWSEIDPLEFLRVFERLSEDARAARSDSSPHSDAGPESREILDRLVAAAVGGPERIRTTTVRLQMPDYAYLAEIGEQLQRYQQGAAALSVFEAMKAAEGGDSTAVLEERILAESLSRRERAVRSESVRRNGRGPYSAGADTLARSVLSESALRVTAAAAARELMLAYRPLVTRLRTESAIRRHFGINEGKRK